MKFPFAIVVLALSAMPSISLAFEFPPLFGTTPDNVIREWTKFNVVGPQNSRFPIILVSPQYFRVSGFPESLIVLSPRKYASFASFTGRWVAASDCRATREKLSEWYTLDISSRSGMHGSECVTLKANACNYFSRLLRVHGIEWGVRDRDLIGRFARSIKCRVGRV